MRADGWRDRNDEANSNLNNSANCLKMNLKIKHTIIWEGIIVLPSVVPVCELLEQMTENAKNKIIPSTQPCFSKSIHRCWAETGLVHKNYVTSYSIRTTKYFK